MLSTHFSLAEFVASDTAARRGIDNDLPPHLLPAAQATAQMLERIRAHLSDIAGKPVPIIVTSGYRSPTLNKAIGSKPTSDHTQAQAADIKAPGFGTAYQVAKALQPHIDALGIGALIHEYGAWVHVSTRRPDRQVNRVLTITAREITPGIKEVS